MKDDDFIFAGFTPYNVKINKDDFITEYKDSKDTLLVSKKTYQHKEIDLKFSYKYGIFIQEYTHMIKKADMERVFKISLMLFITLECLSEVNKIVLSKNTDEPSCIYYNMIKNNQYVLIAISDTLVSEHDLDQYIEKVMQCIKAIDKVKTIYLRRMVNSTDTGWEYLYSLIGIRHKWRLFDYKR